MSDSERDVDLFAGPGGWDEGAAALGVRPLGIEWDDAACATRRARGHETLQADVSALDPREFAPVRGLIASPPCQVFSMAGNGAGRRALGAYRIALQDIAVGAGAAIDREWLDRECGDPRGHLVLEPLRWAVVLRPEWIALEQVEPVLPLWEALADVLRARGYGVWTGVLSAERYGVPQTRKRAILLAKLDGEVSEPPATHQRYVPPRVKAKQEESLFAAPEPERIVLAEDRELLPWVSMAEALGWGMTARPSVVVASGGESRRGAKPLGGGSGSQSTLEREQDAGAWRSSDRVGFPRRADSGSAVEIDGQDYRDRDFRLASEPAFALTEKARSVVRLRANAQPNAAVRSVDEPAPTSEPAPAVTAKLGGQAQWVRARDGREDGPRDPEWPSKRPATTVAGDPRLAQPGHKNEEAMPDCPGRMEGAIRVSVAEASVLQSFPPDYPWQGARTAQYRQIGDAVPPVLARAILAHLLR